MSSALIYQLPQPVIPFWPVKGVGAVLDYSWDMAADLTTAGAVDGVTSAQLSVMPSGIGEMTALNLSVSGTVLTVWFSGGVGGRSYTVSIQATTDAGRTFNYFVYLKCDPTGAAYPLPLPTSNGFSTPISWKLGDLTLEDISGDMLGEDGSNLLQEA